MAIKDDFIEDIQIGDYVEITYGLQNESTVRGFVTKLSESSVKIRTASGEPRINLDHLVSYDTPPAPVEGEQEETVAEPTVAKAVKEEIKTVEKNPLDELLASIKNAKGASLAEVANTEYIRSCFDDCEKDVCRVVDSIISTFINLLKNNSVKSLRNSDKLHDLRAKAKTLLFKNPDLNEDISALLGSLYFQIEDFEQSEKYYAEARDFYGAAYAVAYADPNQKRNDYLDSYVAEAQITDLYLFNKYAFDCVSRKSVRALSVRVNTLATEIPLKGEDKKELDALYGCAMLISELAGVARPRSCSLNDDGEMLQALLTFIDLLPSDWIKVNGGTLSEEISRRKAAEHETFTSVIQNFDPVRLIGFIREDNLNRYFYINNVRKEDELRAALQKGCAQNLEVTYQLGKAYRPDKPASAYNIMLTERGRAEAVKRLEKGTQKEECSEQVLYGDLTEYNMWEQFGRILGAGDTEYNFKTNAIDDIRLLAYLVMTGNPDIRVRFQTKLYKGETVVAANITIAEDVECNVTEADIQRLIKMGDITAADVARCEKASKKASEGSAAVEEKTTAVSDFYELPYEDLEPYVPVSIPVPTQGNTSVSASAIGAQAPSQKKIVEIEHPKATVPAGSDDLKLPPLEPIDRNPVNLFANLEPLMGFYYEEAHQKMILNDLSAAEILYIKALRAGDRIDSSVADLATVYMRDADRFKDAWDLMDIYGGYLPADKRMNILIQIFQKKKERACQIKLCHLYVEALSGNLQISTRFHYLLSLSTVLCNLEEYSSSLNACRKVRQLYDTEVKYGGSDAAAKHLTRLNQVKRLEASCYYFLGERQKANELAREMLNISNSDVIAGQILEGTLTKNGGMIVPEDQWRSESSEVVTDFASARVEEVSLSRYLKGVGEGEYTGNPQKAAENIKQLLDARGKTPFYRSETLMCAAKIIRSIRQRFGEKGTDPSDSNSFRHYGLTPKYEKIYIARSMASYGDYILEQQKNKDTARYSYLQALDLLEENETDWQMALHYYVASYFNGQVEMAGIINKDYMSAGTRKPDLTMLLTGKPLDIGEFTVGLLRLRKCLRNVDKVGNTKANNNLTDLIRKGRFLEDIKAWCNARTAEINWNHADGLNYALDQAGHIMTNAEKTLGEYLETLPARIMNNAGGASICSQINDMSLTDWLIGTDKRHVETLSRIMGDFRAYFVNPAFQYRSTVLNSAVQRITNLMGEISGSPTAWSYDVLLPVLNRTREILLGEQDALYLSQPPEIVISLTEEMPPYLGTNNEVYVHLNVSNGGTRTEGAERQLADNLTLSVAAGAGVSFARFESESIGFVNGGESKEAILVFQIQDESVFLFGSFDLKVECRYKYNERFNEAKEGYAEFSDSIGFRRDQHIKIANPYSQHIGSEMKDESMFYGRDALIGELVDSITLTFNDKLNYGLGILLYGQTRAGKSSIRHHFAKRVRQNFSNIVLVDMENLNGNSLDEVAFYWNLVNMLEVELQNNHPHLASILRESGVTAPTQERLLAHPQHVAMLFDRYIRQVIALLNQKDRMIVLVADEFSSIHLAIKEGRLSKSFLQTWKAMLENYGFFAVCFGQDDTPQFVRMNENAFARMRQIKVTYLEELAAKRLIAEPIDIVDAEGGRISRFAPAALDELYMLTAGSAFLIIKVCSLLVDYLNTKGVSRVTPGILQNFLNTAVFEGNSCLTESDFEPQINDRGDESLKDVNRALLLDIARKSRADGWADVGAISLEGSDVTSVHSVKMLLNRLEERDVIEIKEGSKCRIKVRLLTTMLLTKYGRS